jgi:hypothetical protein
VRTLVNMGAITVCNLQANQISAHRECLYVTLHGRKYSMHPPLADTLEMFDSSILEVNIPQMDAVCSVTIDEDNGELSWPVLIVYDMCQQTDFVRAFREGTVLIGHIFVNETNYSWNCFLTHTAVAVYSFATKRVSCQIKWPKSCRHLPIGTKWASIQWTT